MWQRNCVAIPYTDTVKLNNAYNLENNTAQTNAKKTFKIADISLVAINRLSNKFQQCIWFRFVTKTFISSYYKLCEKTWFIPLSHISGRHVESSRMTGLGQSRNGRRGTSWTSGYIHVPRKLSMFNFLSLSILKKNDMCQCHEPCSDQDHLGVLLYHRQFGECHGAFLEATWTLPAVRTGSDDVTASSDKV